MTSNSSSSQPIEGRELLGDVGGMALREDHDPRGEPKFLGDGGRVGERQDGIRDRGAFGPRHPAVLAVRILRLITDRHDHVFDGPDRLDAHLVRRSHQYFEGVGVGERARIGEEEAELHGEVSWGCR